MNDKKNTYFSLDNLTNRQFDESFKLKFKTILTSTSKIHYSSKKKKKRKKKPKKNDFSHATKQTIFGIKQLLLALGRQRGQ